MYENVWQNTLFCKNYEKSREMKRRYLEKISYEDVRHGFRKLRRSCLDLSLSRKRKNMILGKLLKICPHSPINTVLGYKKGLKTRNVFRFSENTSFQLSNALSIVLTSFKLVKIQQNRYLSVAPPTGFDALPTLYYESFIILAVRVIF